MHRFDARPRLWQEDSSKISNREILWLFRRFLAPYQRGLGLVALLLLAVMGFSIAMPYLIKLAVDGPMAAGDVGGVLEYGLLYFACIFGLFAARFSHSYLLQTIGQNTLRDLRQHLFGHILQQDMRFFNKTPVGQLVARFSNDIDALTELFSTSFVVVVSNFITLAGIIVVMFLLDWRMALISLAMLPLMLAASAYFGNRLRLVSARYHSTVGEYLAYLNEQLNGMQVVQLFNRQADSRQHFRQVNSKIRNSHMELRDAYTVYASGLQVLGTAGLALVLYGGGQWVGGGVVTLGTLLAFIEYNRRMFEPIQLLAEQVGQVQNALAAGERVARLLQAHPGLEAPPRPQSIPQFCGEVRFQGVSFAYQPGALVLKDIHLHIRPGEMLAIVGATGAGKTSLAGLLARFYEVEAGAILIDGVDVRQLSWADLRHYVTVVPQNPYCFNGTVADNLRLFDPSISEAAMREAAEVACAAPFIAALPGAYDHPLLPGGANLSQGQRQLLALTRALIHHPQSILVLDEATSSIDTDTEAHIQAGLRRVLAGRTSIIIAHRLSTIREADRIILLSGGEIAESGTHEELLALGGLYAALYQKQFEEAETEVMRPEDLL
jgi:ATP-binding cassette subfamily B protein